MNVITSLVAAMLTILPVGAAAPVQPDQIPDPCGMLSDQRVVTCFSDPTTNDPRILDSITALVDSAGDGDTIEIMMYSWRNNELPVRVADRVVAAYERGVDVRVILDEASSKYEPIDILRAADVPLVVCDDAGNREDNCLMVDDPDYYDPDNKQPMNHTKLLLFDIDGKKSVVGGSANFGDSGYYTSWNDMVRIHDAGLHSYLTDWFARVWSDDWQGWDSDSDRWGSGDPAPGAKDLREMAYVYPRKSADPIGNTLKRTTTCHSDGDDDGDWDKRVWVAISSWKQGARSQILDQLERLNGEGCDVRVMLADNISVEHATQLRERISGSASDSSEVRYVCKIHHKMVILDAKYRGAYHEVVVTGSNIWTNGSLGYSTELNLRLGGEDNDTDDGAVRKYIVHYDKLWDERSKASC